MRHRLVGDLRALQGRRVSVALTDQSCIHDGFLLGVTAERVWLDSSGEETFVSLADVVDFWETRG
ncbi:MAG TPA: hypothetical protein VM242_03845 [Acidimicrobiales bacterium]|jgi:hypothetical protein|nr:hypothetical protein [Acidimicrobiales bacterium]